MVIIFGPAGAGKSLQGQMMAARQGWSWLSMGQILRDTRDKELFDIMQAGKLVPAEKVNEIVDKAIERVSDTRKVILDGYPRNIEQATWLVENQPVHGHSVNVVIVLDVPREELIKRLSLRGRVDDLPEVIDERINIFHKQTEPILDYFCKHGVQVSHVSGVGHVGEIHDRIMEVLDSCGVS